MSARASFASSPSARALSPPINTFLLLLMVVFCHAGSSFDIDMFNGHMVMSMAAAAGTLLVQLKNTNVQPHTSSDHHKQLVDEKTRRQRLKNCHAFQAETGAPGVAIGISVDGREVFAGGYGYADVENDVKMTSRSVMRIASISKPMTATIVARLVDDGRLNFDDSIWKHVPGFPQKTYKDKLVDITIRNLLNHTAGIRHYQELKDTNPDYKKLDECYSSYGTTEDSKEATKGEPLSRYAFKSSREAIDVFAKDDLVLNQQSNYSTFGYTLLGLCCEVAAASATSIEPTITKLLDTMFQELDMKSTRVDSNEALITNRARMYRRNRHNLLVNVPETDCSYKIAGGGIVSNVHDLLRFANAMLLSYQTDGWDDDDLPTLMRQSTAIKMWDCEGQGTSSSSRTKFHLGWMSLDDVKNVRYHSGASVGTTTLLLVKRRDEPHKQQSPPRGISIVILVNLADAEFAPIWKVGQDLVAEFEDPTAATAA